MILRTRFLLAAVVLTLTLGWVSDSSAHNVAETAGAKRDAEACFRLIEQASPVRRRDALKRYGTMLSLEEPAYLDAFFKRLRRTLDQSPVRLEHPLLPTVHDAIEPTMLRLHPDLVRLDPRDHEVRTARFYADHVARRHEETFLFLPAYETYPVPSSDGIVFGPNGEVRANVSLKYSRHNLEKFEEAIAGAQRFAVVEEWYEPLIRTSGEFLMTSGQWKHTLGVLGRRAKLSWLMGAQFRDGGKAPRKTRIVILLMNGYDPDFLNREAPRIRSRLWEARDVVESATFINDGEVTELRPARELDDHELSLGWNRD